MRVRVSLVDSPRRKKICINADGSHHVVLVLSADILLELAKDFSERRGDVSLELR